MRSFVRRSLLIATTLAAVTLSSYEVNAQEPAGRVTILELTPHGLIVEAIDRIEAENYTGAIELLEEWPTDLGEPPPEALYLLAVAHYRLGNFAEAVPPAERAATQAPDAPVHWVELVADLLKRTERHREAIPWLERLVETDAGNKTYWLELSLAYEQVDDYERALATMRLANTAELLTDEADYRRLSDLLLYQGLPRQAADVLEQAIAERIVTADEATYTKLGFAWTAAGDLDRAVTALEAAARAANDGNAYVRLGALQIERQAWPAAVAALHAAMDRGELNDPAHASLLMGIALYRQGRLEEAREWLTAAAEAEAHREAANDYLEAIDARRG
jgi:tetratricopeptide (TPR) repeat protein